MPNVCEKCGKCYTPDNDLCADCDLAETTELYEEITQLKAELAEARAEVEHWKGECSDLVRMAHEMRAEIDYFQTLIDLQHKRTVEADKLWQQAHNQPNVWPDLGALIKWLVSEIENKQYTITCASEENQQLKESLAEARAEIERKDKLIEQMETNNLGRETT
jgi:predicted  nucleic acid-binding Zn-ribbon protein